MKFFKKLKLFYLASLNNSTFAMGGNKIAPVSKFIDKKNVDAVRLPNDIEKIKRYDFADFISLKNVFFPKNLKEIDEKAFFNCKSLDKIKLPKKVQSIGNSAFAYCNNLKEIILPNSITHIGNDCFYNCNSVQSIKLPKFADNYMAFPVNLFYLSKVGNDFYLKSKPSKNSIFIADISLVKYSIKNWGNDNLNSTLKNLNNLPPELFSYFYKQAQGDKALNFVDDILNSNIKKYVWLRRKSIHYAGVMDHFVGICEILGVFEKTPRTTQRISKSNKQITETIDYAQKATEFLYQAIKCNKLDVVDAEKISKKVKSFKFHPEFADFVFKNLDEILKEGPIFFAECYNRFDEVQKAHTTNKGGCRQLAPTVEFFKQYFNSNKFIGVTKENQEIANVVGKYYTKQETFDTAVKVMKLGVKKHIPANILKEDLKEDIILSAPFDKEGNESNNQFNKINERIKRVVRLSNDTLSDLVDVANNKFSFELLRKDSALNLVLGKMCGCCAHLEGIGASIAFSAILHPDIQNIVIKNNKGDIIAKTTIYVNRKEGYAICNTIELNERIKASQKDAIYYAFKQAINTFAEKYNQENDIKLKIINVGMNFNDLHEKIAHTDKKAKFLLKPIDYSQFSLKEGGDYRGDSFDNQYTLWKIDKEKDF